MTINQRIIYTTPVLWLGFVLAISFMEAWLKFQAPGVTEVIGVSIGRLVFGVLNKIEWFFILVLLCTSLRTYGYTINNSFKSPLLLLIVILLVQTFYLLPVLDRRAILMIEGWTAPQGYDHLIYVLLELVKVISLVFLSHQILTKNQLH